MQKSIFIQVAGQMKNIIDTSHIFSDILGRIFSLLQICFQNFSFHLQTKISGQVFKLDRTVIINLVCQHRL